ncbi:hypothetical protein [Streptomyces qaidamensis]|uniref:hypothetical protein n=1 Tax=Streptomyces qaidamensis TaxID=1783515 RepID=UPI00131C0B2F|nr:hypothetical protein [Streptomyces qaidamensis]
MTDLHTSEAVTGAGDRSRPRAVLPALCATQITGWGIVCYACRPGVQQKPSRSPPAR